MFVFPEVVKEYIQEAKAQISQTCQDMEVGVNLTSHYVDVQVSQRDVFFQCGKSTSKVQDKELIIMGDADRQKSLLGRHQVMLLLTRKIITMNIYCLLPFEHSNSTPST